MQLPETIPAHQLLTPDIARVIYEQLANVTTAAINDDVHVNEMSDFLARASEVIQQTVVEFVQAEIERAERNGRPFRLVARCA
jgi:hypothetical protein